MENKLAFCKSNKDLKLVSDYQNMNFVKQKQIIRTFQFQQQQKNVFLIKTIKFNNNLVPHPNSFPEIVIFSFFF